ncbi:hypothetical protein K435DRAFT_809118 [Dendrothele bispora CBS 962.96]|uniref:C2H2-type domain-containing protein n=1 Tax=Dendrothele bispora (strain CBS 962.96) TaxID=1314807 RepID=A0A4V4HC02_DENBC|nr:hypothetical protein K435DRAFT_809118 [Dendrothele bispora CBS 962.96]
MNPVTVWEGSSESPVPILETSDSFGTTSDGTANVEHPQFLTSHSEPLLFDSFPFDLGWPAELVQSLTERPHSFDNAGLSDLGNQRLTTYNDQPSNTNNTESLNPDCNSPLQDPLAWLERHSCSSPYYDRHHDHEYEHSLGATGKYMRLPSLSIPDQSVHYEGIHSSTGSSSTIGCLNSAVTLVDTDLSGGGWKKCVSTPATIEAANRRRKSRNKKFFFCPHCGRDFTANHNLKQSTLVNGVVAASLRLIRGKGTKESVEMLRFEMDAEQSS